MVRASTLKRGKGFLMSAFRYLGEGGFPRRIRAYVEQCRAAERGLQPGACTAAQRKGRESPSSASCTDSGSNSEFGSFPSTPPTNPCQSGGREGCGGCQELGALRHSVRGLRVMLTPPSLTQGSLTYRAALAAGSSQCIPSWDHSSLQHLNAHISAPCPALLCSALRPRMQSSRAGTQTYSGAEVRIQKKEKTLLIPPPRVISTHQSA